jgi:hypothetical protein
MTTRITRNDSREKYLDEIERLAKAVVDAAISEGSFEVFVDEGEKTSLQKAVTALAQTLRYLHDKHDRCVGP